MNRPDELELDGCAIAGDGPYTADDDVDGLVLFAGVDFENPDAVERRRLEWVELFG